MDRRTFDAFRELVRDTTGISLSENKEVLLCARLAKRMRALGLDDYEGYLQHVLEDHSGDELVMLVDAVSTNVTSFFREQDHFDFAARLMRKWEEEGRTRVRLWSVACSSGEEPYSLGMVLRDNMSSPALDARILATDIAVSALEAGRRATYSAEKVARVPSAFAQKYLRRTSSGAYRVTQDVRDLVTFARLNLSSPPFPMSGPFDLIVCRNVMIYFDPTTRSELLAEMERLLRPGGGVLMLGHAESLTGMESGLKVVAPSVYEKV